MQPTLDQGKAIWIQRSQSQAVAAKSRNTGEGENGDGYFKQKGPQVQGREVMCL